MNLLFYSCRRGWRGLSPFHVSPDDGGIGIVYDTHRVRWQPLKPRAKASSLCLLYYRIAILYPLAPLLHFHISRFTYKNRNHLRWSMGFGLMAHELCMKMSESVFSFSLYQQEFTHHNFNVAHQIPNESHGVRPGWIPFCRLSEIRWSTADLDGNDNDSRDAKPWVLVGYWAPFWLLWSVVIRSSLIMCIVFCRIMQLSWLPHLYRWSLVVL